MLMLIYDCEIARAIADPADRLPGVAYCDGWRDFAGMGIACIVAMELGTDRYHVFCRDNLADFQVLVDRADVIVGYNCLAFDNPLCRAHGLRVPDDKTFDLLAAIWMAAGLEPTYQGDGHKPFSLDAMAMVNLGHGKTGHGALAPLHYQFGRMGRLIRYCVDDVWLTAQLLYQVVGLGYLGHPQSLERLLIDVPAWVREGAGYPLAKAVWEARWRCAHATR